MNSKYKNLSSIFLKKTNEKYKLIPFKIRVNDVGNTKYYPASSKE